MQLPGAYVGPVSQYIAGVGSSGYFDRIERATGQVIVGASGQITATPAAGQIMTVAGALTVTGAMTVGSTVYPGTYTSGDLLYASAANTLSKRSIGTAGKILRSDGSFPTWTSAAYPDSAAAGDLLYGFATNTWSALTKGSARQLLQMNAGATAPEWTSNVAVPGTLDSTGNFSVAASKFTVAAASGNTVVAGTLAVTGAGTFTGNLTRNGSGTAAGYLNVNNTGNDAYFGVNNSAGNTFAASAYDTVVQAATGNAVSLSVAGTGAIVRAVAAGATVTGTLAVTSTSVLNTQVRVTPGGTGNIKLGANATFANIPGVSLNDDLTDAGCIGLFGDATNLYIQAKSAGSLIFRSNGNTEVGRWTSGGILAIGTTVTTTAAAGDLVVPFAKGLRSVNSTTSDTNRLIAYDAAEEIVQIGEGTRLVGIRTIAAASMPAGSATRNGCLIIDSTNNRLIYFSGGNHYYLAGTSF